MKLRRCKRPYPRPLLLTTATRTFCLFFVHTTDHVLKDVPKMSHARPCSTRHDWMPPKNRLGLEVRYFTASSPRCFPNSPAQSGRADMVPDWEYSPFL